MKSGSEYENRIKALREEAERHLMNSPSPQTNFTREEVEKLLHELSVHQIELQVQYEELLFAQQSLNEIFEHAPVGLVLLDENLEINRVNARFCKLTKQEPDDLSEKPFAQFLGNDDTNAFFAMVQQLRDGETPAALRVSFQVSKNKQHYVEIEGHTATSPDDSENYIQLACVDIDASIRAIHARKEVEERLQRVVSATSDAIWEWYPKDKQLYLSPGWYELTGTEKIDDSAPYEDWLAPIHPEDRSVFERELGRCIYRRDADTFKLEFRILSKDGATQWIFCRAEVIKRDTDDTALLISGSMSDVTEQRAAEERLRASQRIYRQFIEHTPIGVCITRPDYTFEYVNPAYCALFGYTESELLGQPFTMVALPENKQALEALHDDFIQCGKEVRGEWEVARKGGKKFHVIADAALTRSIDGERRKATFVVDITERKEMEKMLIHSERMAAVGTLAAGVAHEYNNAMAGVTGYLGLLLQNPEIDEKTRSRLQKMEGAAERIVNVTRNLLTFSRNESVGKRPCSLANLVRETLLLIEDEIRTDLITLTLDLDEETFAACVRNEIGQVLLNLVINARHGLLGENSKSIQVKVGSEGRRAYIRVIDTGCGISADDLPNVKLPFFSRKGEFASGDTPQSWVRGTGLGLSVSDRIIQNHGGELEITSTPGVGTTITIWLPRADVIKNTHGRQNASSTQQSTSATASSKRIMMVDDEAIVREPIGEMLENNGYAVTSTDDGARALSLLRQEPYDLMIIDLMMPKMTGEEILQAFETLPENHRPACIIMTGRLSNESMANLPLHLVHDTLLKPCRNKQVLAAVQNALQSKTTDIES